VESYIAAKYVAEKYNWSVIPCAANATDMKTIDEIHDLIKKEVKAILPKKTAPATAE
jgi:hypothetical protein